MDPTLSGESAAEMTCPACRARQAWSDTCRRCRCDLSLLRAVYERGELERRKSLHAVEEGRYDEALQHARQHARIIGSEPAQRLLAVCHFICENWAEARYIATDSGFPEAERS